MCINIALPVISVTGAYFWFDGQVPLLTSYKPTLNFYLTPVIVSNLILLL